MTVGAVLYGQYSVFDLTQHWFLVENRTLFPLLLFSSRGGTLTNGVVRNKPDFHCTKWGEIPPLLWRPNWKMWTFQTSLERLPLHPLRLPIAAWSSKPAFKYYLVSKPARWIGRSWCQLTCRHPRVTKTQHKDMHESGRWIQSQDLDLVRAESSITFTRPHQILISNRNWLWRGC